jgi:hypothetical protein
MIIAGSLSIPVLTVVSQLTADKAMGKTASILVIPFVLVIAVYYTALITLKTMHGEYERND